MKYLKAIDPITGMIDPNKICVLLADGTMTIMTSDQPEYLGYLKDTLAPAVDDLIASIYSNFTRFQQEYLLRQSAAQAFKDANYQGDPGVWITAFASSIGITVKQAADTILSQSANLNSALLALGALRMRKYEIGNALDSASAQAIYNDIVTKIKQVASTLS